MRAEQPHNDHWRWIAPAAVLLATALAYLPALQAGFTNWDDKAYVLQNDAMLSGDLWQLLKEPCAGNFHPLTMLSLWLNHVLFGPGAFSYHLVNLLLHLVCTWLVFRLAWRLSGNSLLVAAFTAGVFGLHPTHVESVAWISERKDVLFATFYLGAMVTYVRYLTQARLGWLLATLLLFMLSLLSKPTAVTFPLVALMLDHLGQRKSSWRLWLEKVPLFALSLALGLLTLHFQAKAGVVGDFESRGVMGRIALSGWGYVLYIVKSVVPYPLAAVHPNPLMSEPLGIHHWLAPLSLLAWLAAVWLLRRKARLVSFGLLFFLVSMLPTLQFISFGEAIMAERYLYLPLVGLGMAVGWGLSRLRPNLRWLQWSLVVTLCLAMGAGTFQRSTVWHDSMTLWNDNIAKYPTNCFTALICRADLHREQQHPGLALVDAEEAIRQRPDHYFGYFSRGNAYYDLQEPGKALEDYSRSLQLYQRDASVWGNRAVIHFNLGHFDQAIRDMDQALGLRPGRAEYWYRRSQAYFYLGNKQAALFDLEQAKERGIVPSQQYLKALDTLK